MDDTIGYFSRSNDILNEFVGILAKNASQKPQRPEVDKEKVLKDFEGFEHIVKSSPEMRQIFAALQDKFTNDPEYTAKVDPNFVAGVMMLDLPNEQE